MGQQEVYSLLERKPRLCTNEIADELNMNLVRIDSIIRRMLKELKVDKPNEEEKERILKKYPHYHKQNFWNKLRIFELKK